MNKKALILSMNPNAYAPKRLKKAFEAMGVEVLSKDFFQVSVYMGEKLSFGIGEINFDEFEYIVLRNPSQSAYKDFDFYHLRQSIAMWAEKNKKRMLNLDLYNKPYSRMDKLSQSVYMRLNGVSIIPTKYGPEISEENPPMIFKTVMGSHGSGVKKVKTERGKKYFSEALGLANIIRQPFIDSGEDYRVIVLGGEVLGVMRRIAVEGGYLTNVSAGGSFEKAELTDELKKLALKAALVFSCDYCGVDIMFDENKTPFVLEVNDSAQFGGFEKATKINVADKIARFMIGK